MKNWLHVIVPMGFMTATSMLAMDLYLPAIPAMQVELGISIAAGQTTVSVFLIGLAASQLFWGEIYTRLGPRATAVPGTIILLGATAAAAMAVDVDRLLIARLLQGVGAGAATVVAPSVIRSMLPQHLTHKGIGAVAMVESVVPAAGPVLGAALLAVTSWRGSFWALFVGGSLVLIVLCMAVLPAQPVRRSAGSGGYLTLLRDARFLRPAVTHALAFAALFAFVASAPQMLKASAGWGPAGFAWLQVLGVLAFMAGTHLTGMWVGGAEDRSVRAARAGAWGHLAIVMAWIGMGSFVQPGVLRFIPFWVVFCALLGVRGPATMNLALSVSPELVGKAAALLMLFVLASCALSTQVIGHFLAEYPVLAVELGMLTLLASSLLAFEAMRPAGLGASPARGEDA